ncbi:site-specific DNA-methyltransferase [Bordetella ansorpii]|uniref:Methyltransferase n=1 Tax=Bordetella ansorpii TaxID=288768 RepID=A0A157SS60_9BORD|nr:DNA methyltransferase [Bordetella ansorpii]SAI73141.1 site-specific DNA-methyltransferase [Bordetella ansorpii]
MGRFILGDCLKVLPEFPDQCVNFILTDPPYLVNFRDRTGRSIANDQDGDWLLPAFAQCHRVLRQNALCVSFYAWNRVDQFFAAWRKAGFRAVGHFVFTKSYASKTRFVRYQHEAAYLLAKGQPDIPASPPPDVLAWRYTGNAHHPTQKPVSCLSALVQAFTQPGDIVLDPFAGSGSTCVAAHQCGRRYVGIELERRYHDAAVARLQTTTREA